MRNGKWLIALALAMFVGRAAAADDANLKTERIPIGRAYADDGVNTSVFRDNSVITLGGYQFVTYYAPDGNVVVGRRQLPSTKWDLAVQSFKGKVSDAHNDVVLGVSSDGLLHISYDHHNNQLHYRVSETPLDVHSFGPEIPMTGQHESSVTYPQFLNGPDGTLYFFYRNGSSGNGSLCLNRYDVALKTWKAMNHPLIDGENKCNPYPWRPAIGSDGSIHIGWCWRDSPDAETNHDLCYTHSTDGGQTWLRSDGKPQATPITQENAQVVDPIRKGSNLINQCSAALDADGHPHLAQYMNDDSGIPQYFDVWFDGTRWNKSQVSHRTKKFSISGGGSLAIPISRPEIAVSKSGAVYFITRDAEVGGGIRLYQSRAPFDQWTTIDLTHENLGNWEPTYDLLGLHDSGVLSLFVLPVEQGNHEHTTNFGPQEAAILQVALP